MLLHAAAEHLFCCCQGMEEEGPFLGFSCMNLAKKLGEGIMLTTWVSIYILYINAKMNDMVTTPIRMNSIPVHIIFGWLGIF